MHVHVLPYCRRELRRVLRHCELLPLSGDLVDRRSFSAGIPTLLTPNLALQQANYITPLM